LVGKGAQGVLDPKLFWRENMLGILEPSSCCCGKECCAFWTPAAVLAGKGALAVWTPAAVLVGKDALGILDPHTRSTNWAALGQHKS